MTCLEKELTEEEPQKEEGGTETQKEKKHRPRERTPKGGQRLTEGERDTKTDGDSRTGSLGTVLRWALHPSRGAIFRRKVDTHLGVGGLIPYPSPSLNIAWQGGRKGVPGLGCPPLFFPIPAKAT